MSNQYKSVLASGSAGTGGDAVAANVLAGKTFTNDNGFDTGTMVNNGAVTQTLSAGQSYTIPEGYHNGNGTVTADSTRNILEIIVLSNTTQYSGALITDIEHGSFNQKPNGTYSDSYISVSDVTVNPKTITKTTSDSSIKVSYASASNDSTSTFTEITTSASTGGAYSNTIIVEKI